MPIDENLPIHNPWEKDFDLIEVQCDYRPYHPMTPNAYSLPMKTCSNGMTEPIIQCAFYQKFNKCIKSPCVCMDQLGNVRKFIYVPKNP